MNEIAATLPTHRPPPRQDSEHGLLLAQVLDSYFAALEAGHAPSQEELLAQYPELADDLEPCLATLNFIGRAVPQSLPLIDPAALDALPAPGVLGDFRILQELGRGGMGVVYEAEQISLNRRVALKVLPFAAVMDPRALQRFKNEAQAAAALDHANIVDVYGVGCERGVHFYAMRLIDGQTLAQVIEALRIADDGCQMPDGGCQMPDDEPAGACPLSVEAETAPHFADVTPPSAHRSSVIRHPSSDIPSGRDFYRFAAQLGIAVAEALDHAHEQGVIHRDIKPSNLMLDSRGKIWIADFGLAHIDANVSMTHTGDLLGTLRYMSPEQALAKRVIVDHRTDIYSLGATLYELLTLRPVFDGQDRQELLRQLSFEEPRPLRQVNKSIPLELETIVLKALEKNPVDRYASAKDLADDLRRFLCDTPLAARRAGLSQRAIKWSRRHPALVASAMVILALSTIGSLTSAVLISRAQAETVRQRNDAETQRDRAQTAETQAKEEAAIAQAVIEFLQNDLLAEAAPDKNPRDKKVTVEELLDRAAARIVGKFDDQPLLEAAIRRPIGNAYLALGVYPAAQPHLERVWELCRRVLGEEQSGTLLATIELATLYRNQGLYAKAEPLLVQTVKIGRRALGEEHPTTVLSMNNLAALYQNQRQYDKAEPLIVKTLEINRRVLGEEHRDTLTTINNLATVYKGQARIPAAEQLFIKVLEVRRRVLGAEHPDTLLSMLNLGKHYSVQLRFDLAEPLLVKGLETSGRVQGEEHPQTLRYMRNLGRHYAVQRRFDLAEPLLVKALEDGRRVLGEDHPDILTTLDNLASLYKEQGQYDKAEALAIMAVDGSRRVLGDEHLDTLCYIANLASLYWSVKKLDRSVPLFEEALNGMQARMGRDHPVTLQTMANLGVNYRDAGRLPEGIALLEQAWETAGKRPGPLPVSIAWIPWGLADTYAAAAQLAKAAGQLAKAESFYVKAEPLLQDRAEFWKQKSGAESPEYASQLAVLGLNLLEQKKHHEAEPRLRECLRIREITQPDLWSTFNTRSLLGGSLLGQENYADAEMLLLAGYEGMKAREEKIPAVGKVRLTESLQRLVDLYVAWGQPEEADKWRKKLPVAQSAEPAETRNE